MASARHRKGASPIVGTNGEAIAELMLEVAQCFFRIRAVGQRAGQERETRLCDGKRECGGLRA